MFWIAIDVAFLNCFFSFLDYCQRINSTLLQPNCGISTSESKPTARLNESIISNNDPPTGTADFTFAIAAE